MMSYCTKFTVSLDNEMVVIKDTFMIGSRNVNEIAIYVKACDESMIGEIVIRYATKSLEERFDNFKNKLHLSKENYAIRYGA